jgi:hypothetical protein
MAASLASTSVALQTIDPAYSATTLAQVGRAVPDRALSQAQWPASGSKASLTAPARRHLLQARQFYAFAKMYLGFYSDSIPDAQAFYRSEACWRLADRAASCAVAHTHLVTSQ